MTKLFFELTIAITNWITGLDGHDLSIWKLGYYSNVLNTVDFVAKVIIFSVIGLVIAWTVIDIICLCVEKKIVVTESEEEEA